MWRLMKTHEKGHRYGFDKYSCYLCQEKQPGFLTLEVRQSNENAIRLYSNAGFVKVGERKNYYSEPAENAILMTKYF